jgi:hypothetical protein
MTHTVNSWGHGTKEWAQAWRAAHKTGYHRDGGEQQMRNDERLSFSMFLEPSSSCLLHL